MPQLIETKVLATKKGIKDEMRTNLSVMKDRMDGLENLGQDRFQAASSTDTEEFRAQLAEMRTRMLSWLKSQYRKHKAREIDKETPTDPAREAIRQEKRARKASKREAQEKEALEQQQRDATLVGASGSGAPAPTNEDQTNHVPSSESAPIDKGANIDPTIGA
uniref:Integrase core domain containing protein n=1 Tax=Solanum tuberosum TaxID=4113 RepID=M1DIR7_SOLTU